MWSQGICRERLCYEENYSCTFVLEGGLSIILKLNNEYIMSSWNHMTFTSHWFLHGKDNNLCFFWHNSEFVILWNKQIQLSLPAISFFFNVLNQISLLYVLNQISKNFIFVRKSKEKTLLKSLKTLSNTLLHDLDEEAECTSTSLLTTQNWEDTRGLYCCPEGPQQAGEMGWQESHAVQQGDVHSCTWGGTTPGTIFKLYICFIYILHIISAVSTIVVPV